MYIKINRKKLPIIEKRKFWERFVGLKFVLEPIDYGVKYPKRKWFNTNFLCQRVDIVLTDKEDKICYIYENFNTEKTIFPKHKVYNVYLLPLGSSTNLKIGEVLRVYKK